MLLFPGWHPVRQALPHWRAASRIAERHGNTIGTLPYLPAVERSAVTSPALTVLILPSPVSTRKAPSLSSPRVVPSKLSSPRLTRTGLPIAYDECAHHSR